MGSSFRGRAEPSGASRRFWAALRRCRASDYWRPGRRSPHRNGRSLSACASCWRPRAWPARWSRTPARAAWRWLGPLATRTCWWSRSPVICVLNECGANGIGPRTWPRVGEGQLEPWQECSTHLGDWAGFDDVAELADESVHEAPHRWLVGEAQDAADIQRGV